MKLRRCLLFFGMLMGLANYGFSQTTPVDCSEAEYNRLVREADSLTIQQQFELAIKKYRVAKICRPTTALTLDAKIDKIYEEILAQRDRAVAGSLANQALELCPKDALLALRLVSTAYRMAPGPQTQEALQEVLRQSLGYTTYCYTHASEMMVNDVECIAFTPDSKRMLAGTNGDGVYLLTPEGHRIAHYYPKNACLSVAFAKDNRHYFVSFLSNACLYDLESDARRCYPGEVGVVNAVAISQDEKYIAFAGRAKSALLWAADSSKSVVLKGHKAEVLAIAFSPDNQFVLTGSADSTARVWNLKGKTQNVLKQHTAEVQAVAFSPDGRYVFTGSHDSFVKRWTFDGTCLNTYYTYFKYFGSIYSIAVSPDGSEIAAAYADGTTTIWDTSGRQLQVLSCKQSSPRALHAVAYSPDGRLIVTAGNDKTVFVWDRSIRLLDLWELSPKRITKAAISADGNYCITAREDSTAVLLDRNGKTIQIFGNNPNVISSVAISSDGQLILLAIRGGLIKLWDAKGKLLQKLEGWQTRNLLKQGIYFIQPSVYFTPNDKAFCIVMDIGSYIEKWGIDGKMIGNYGDGDESTLCSAMAPNGKMMVTGSINGSISLWDSTGFFIQYFQAHKSRVTAIAFSPDGQQIVSGAADGQVKVWKLDSTLVQTFSGHKYAVQQVGFTTDGQKVFSTCNKEAKIWDLRDGLLQTYQGQEGTILDIKQTADGKSFLTVGRDGILAKWKAIWTILEDPLLSRLTTEQKVQFKVPDGF